MPDIDLIAEQKRDEKIQFGMELRDFLSTSCGKLVLELINIKISLMCADAMLKKHHKGDDKGKFVYESMAEMERVRGFVLGLQWVTDEWLSIMNTAERLDLESKKLDNQ